MYDEFRGDWDAEPIGSVESPTRRGWNHGRNHYLAAMLTMFGVFVTIGAIGNPDRTTLRVIGALCVLASPLAVTLSDRAAKRSSDGVRLTPLRTELVWLAAAAALAGGGLLAFARS